MVLMVKNTGAKIIHYLAVIKYRVYPIVAVIRKLISETKNNRQSTCDTTVTKITREFH